CDKAMYGKLEKGFDSLAQGFDSFAYFFPTAKTSKPHLFLLDRTEMKEYLAAQCVFYKDSVNKFLKICL
ncbi:MAG: hypothetical protein RR777_01520, partial [Christensenellaceae bacterium]